MINATSTLIQAVVHFLMAIGRKIPNLKSTIKNSKSRKKLTNFSRAEVNG